MKRLIFKREDLSLLPTPEVGYKTIGIDSDGIVKTIDDQGVIEGVGGGGDNIYTTDGTLTGNRTVNLAGNELIINGGAANYAGIKTSSGGGAMLDILDNDTPFMKFWKVGGITAFYPYYGTSVYYIRGLTNGISITNEALTRGIGVDDAGIGLSHNTGYIQLACGTAMSFTVGAATTPIQAIQISAAGNVGIGNALTASAKLQVKGAGSTSGTTALLVQNSAVVPANLLEIKDDGSTLIRGTNTLGSTFALTIIDGAVSPNNILAVANDGKMTFGLSTTTAGAYTYSANQAGSAHIAVIENRATSVNSGSGMIFKNNSKLGWLSQTGPSFGAISNRLVFYQQGSGMSFGATDATGDFIFSIGGAGDAASKHIQRLYQSTKNIITEWKFESSLNVSRIGAAVEMAVVDDTNAAEKSELNLFGGAAGTLLKGATINTDGNFIQKASSTAVADADLENNEMALYFSGDDLIIKRKDNGGVVKTLNIGTLA